MTCKKEILILLVLFNELEWGFTFLTTSDYLCFICFHIFAFSFLYLMILASVAAPHLLIRLMGNSLPKIWLKVSAI